MQADLAGLDVLITGVAVIDTEVAGVGAPAARRAALRGVEFFEDFAQGPSLDRVGIFGLRQAALIVALDPGIGLGRGDTEAGIAGCSPRVSSDRDLERELDGDVVVWGGGVACHVWLLSLAATEARPHLDVGGARRSTRGRKQGRPSTQACVPERLTCPGRPEGRISARFVGMSWVRAAVPLVIE